MERAQGKNTKPKTVYKKCTKVDAGGGGAMFDFGWKRSEKVGKGRKRSRLEKVGKGI